MRYLGKIVRLQYQQDPLKVRDGAFKRYDPANIITAESLRFAPDGVEAGDAANPILDVHHRLHPKSGNRADNGVSICFTGHYAEIREHFGPRLIDGIAGENILVDFDGHITESELAHGVLFRTASGPVQLHDLIVAPPCVEFSRFSLDYPQDQKPDRSVSDAVQFLHQGMRGFYATVHDPFTLTLGYEVWLPEAPGDTALDS